MTLPSLLNIALQSLHCFQEAEARAAQASGAGVGETGGSHWFAEVS